MFFKLLRERWGEALNNVLDYFRDLLIDEEPCGLCRCVGAKPNKKLKKNFSYQHSCGRKCNRRYLSS